MDSFIEFERVGLGRIYINPSHVQAIVFTTNQAPDESLLWLSDAETTVVVRGAPQDVAARLVGKATKAPKLPDPQAAVRLAAQMDRIGIPVSHGSNKVRRALRENGVGKRDTLIAAAIRYRKQEAAVSAHAAS